MTTHAALVELDIARELIRKGAASHRQQQTHPHTGIHCGAAITAPSWSDTGRSEEVDVMPSIFYRRHRNKNVLSFTQEVAGRRAVCNDTSSVSTS
uniref:Uncharacterized protein n=1 Tax=Piliocolobus tephrosceles TaxID=591936 RepID=A0A8C9GK55_9PRIM